MVTLTQDYYDECNELGKFATVDAAKAAAEEKANLRSPEWVELSNGHITTEHGLEGYLTIRPANENNL